LQREFFVNSSAGRSLPDREHSTRESAEAELKHLLGKGSQTFSVRGEWLERVRENFKPDER